jgi:hypothetical protein
MRLHTRKRTSTCTVPMSAVTTTNKWHNDAAEVDFRTDQLWAALCDNTGDVTGTTGLVRQTLLLKRAEICEELARIAGSAFAHYRKLAEVYRQEADTLNSSTHSDLHDGEKAAA